MICRKCASIFDDSISACPDCGTPVFGEENEESEAQEKAYEPDAEQPEAENEEETATDIETEADIEAEAENMTPPEYEEKPVLIKTAPTKKRSIRRGGVEKINVESIELGEQGSSSDRKKMKAKPEKESIGDKSAAILIIALVSILSVMAVALAAVSIKSDVFKEDDGVKTMALSGLSGEETGALEQWISDVGYVFSQPFDPDVNSAEDVLKLMGVGAPDGLYTLLLGNAEKTQDKADPANRFAAENGEYSYFRIKEEKIADILALFSLESDRTLNSDYGYYYNGYYYLAANTEPEAGAKGYVADVSSSQKIQDGSFYVKYHLLDEESLSDDIGDRYAIVEKPALGEEAWTVKKISSEPIFDLAGVMIRQEEAVEMKKETISLEADDGTVYHRVIVEYPVFKGETDGEVIVNDMFKNMISSYKQSAETVEDSYQHYIKNGGKAKQLPLVTVIRSEITCMNESYIGFFEETAEYVPESMPVEKTEEQGAQEAQQEEADKPVNFARRIVEGYTIDTETGEFISKDAVIGKDYQNISKLLYRIYNGYDYSDVVAAIESQQAEEGEEDNTSSENADIPEDEKGMGMKIYEGAGALSDEGYVFCFINEKGFSEKVVIPFGISALFQGDFAKTVADE